MNVRARLGCGALLAALLLLFGCSTATKSPLAPSSGVDGSTGLDATLRASGLGPFDRRDVTTGSRFFPLDSGSVWIYTVDQRTVMSDLSAPPDTVLDHGSMTTRMLGTFDVGGTPYTLSTETTDIRGREFEVDVAYRQDATGLYELDLPIRGTQSSARVSRIHDAVEAHIASGRPQDRAAALRALANLEARLARVDGLLHAARPVLTTGPQGQPEIQRLAYPLYVGHEWVLRGDPLFTERVEAREAIAVGNRRLIAWRIRIESDLFGPEDRVWFWVSHEGQLRFRDHLVGNIVDDLGNVIGTVVSDEDRRLVEYQLAGTLPVGGPIHPTTPFGGGTALREARSLATR